MNEKKLRQKAAELIEDRLMSVQDLAKELNISQPTLKKIRDTEDSVSLGMVLNIVNELKK